MRFLALALPALRSLGVVGALTLTLFGCLPQQTPAVDTTESGAQLHDSQAPELVETGSLIPVTQMLPSGVLEIGNPQAPHTLIVFTEFHCHYCAEFHSEQLPLLLADYVDTNQLKLQIVPFVLSKYENSAELAKIAYCATAQNKGLEAHKALYENQLYATKEIDEQAMANCMSGSGTTALLNEQKAWAESLGAEFVPTFFLDGEKFVGLPYYADLRGRIEDVIDRT